MKPPPLLLGAVLLFWGWQSELFLIGAIMALVLESTHFIKARWELSDEDFTRIWTFCAILLLASLVYAFTANDGLSSFSRILQNPTPGRINSAGSSSARTATAMLRWLPMIFFSFVAAQRFSTREAIPLVTISLIHRRRWKKAKQLGGPLSAAKDVQIGYPFFAMCLLAASVHSAENTTFFWGLCVLLIWGFWIQRSRRFTIAVWATALGISVVLGYYGQSGLGHLQRYLENLNPQFFSRLARQSFDPTQSRTMLGQIGDLKGSGKIVIRLEPREGSAAPTYLRAASYRSYKSRAWSAGTSRDDFTDLREQPPNSGDWPLIPGKSNSAIASIACYLDGRAKESRLPAGLLPLPGGSGLLEHLPPLRLQKNSAGAVLAEGPGLVMFDARFGPGATIDSPANTNEDLLVTNEMSALDRVIAELNVDGQSTEKKLQAVSAFFADKFTYSTWQSPTNAPGTNETPLSVFLLRTRSGHCEYFASATVLLLRRLGIPARYAVGFFVHENAANKYVVRLRDAHAWCLVWDRKNSVWRDFDTTPASWVEVEGKRASSFQWLSDLWSRIKFEFAKVWWGQGRLRQYLIWLFVPVLVLLLYQIIFRRGRKRQQKKAVTEERPNNWPGQDSEFYQLEKKLAERGVPRGESEPLSEWLLRVLDTPDFTELRRPLQELLRLHYSYRFDPQGLNEADREALKREARACLEGLTQTKRAAVR